MLVRVSRIACSWIVVAACACAAHAADEFPYVAYVIDADAYVRSGPGREHYPTGQLPAGYAVEVYRHDGAGWCAIRPPEGSFSLAPLHQLRLVDQRTAEVVSDGVVARVGSSLGSQHGAVQVMLERGEMVALLEQPSPTNPWVRIAPPAGEFRWIAARRVSRTPPVESPLAANSAGWQSNTHTRAMTGGSATAEPGDEGAFAGDPFAHLRAAAAVAPTTPTPVLAAALTATQAAWQPPVPATSTAPGVTATGGASDDFKIIAGSPADVRQAQYQEPLPPVQQTVAAVTPPPLADSAAAAPLAAPPRVRFEGISAPTGPLDPRVSEMQLHLSQIVVGPMGAWQFTGLREETAALLAQEQSPVVRAQLRDLLDRIVMFETVQTRRMSGMATTPVAASTRTLAPATAVATGDTAEVLARVRSDLGAGDSGVTPTPGGPAPAATEALYDAVGTLKPVVSKRQGAPQFALIDDHGDVVTFVTASPDVNLQAFIGQRIGVRGNRGFMPEYRRAHVTASRITPLEQTLVK
jgi:hypothetical protein